MTDERRTVAGWVHHLTAPDAQLSLDELNALSLLHIRDNALEMRRAAEHTESMLGALDLFAAGIAERSGMPYAGDGQVRAALDAARDEQRRQAALSAAPDGGPEAVSRA
jgi:hypothetical protein